MQEKSRILKKINSECFGGSENQLRLLLKHLPDESFKDINLILNNTNDDLIEKDKINVLWMQHFVNQEEAKNLGLYYQDVKNNKSFKKVWSYGVYHGRNTDVIWRCFS